jgi:undecaprenyl phosphate-alpha-L-ara4FN deformylase
VKLGLRVDVDTFRGTREGLPRLQAALDRREIRASFFLTVGPDNMGRHLRRLLRPSFALKMLRSGAPSLYGWDILLRGTLWPGPIIHQRLAPLIRALGESPHELGTHAWDHHLWQVAAHRLPLERVRAEIQRAHQAIEATARRAPTCIAAPGWRCTTNLLRLREGLGYRYASDCRGSGAFQPLGEDGRPAGPPQLPVNLPTWDEVVGREGISSDDFPRVIRALLQPKGWNVLTAHAECEGGIAAPMFERLLDELLEQGWSIVPLGDLLPAQIPQGALTQGSVPGREGWLGVKR